MRKLKIRIILLPVILISCFVHAQNNCGAALVDADKLYQKGKFQEVISMLEPCLQKGFAKEQKFDAYRLIALSNQGMLNIVTSKKYIVLMLKVQPDYQKFPGIDPIEFTKLVNTFKVRPLVYAGIVSGVNLTGVKLNKSYAVYAGNQYYDRTLGYHFGVFPEYFIRDFLSIRGNLMIDRLSIEHTVETPGGWTQIMQESQNFILIEPSINYYHSLFNKFKLKAGLGYGFNIMQSADVFFQNINEEGGINHLATKNAIDERNKLQMFVSPNMGLYYPVGIGSMGIEATYWHFFTSTVNPEERMKDENFIFNNQYVADDISLRSLNFSLVYKIPLTYKIEEK